MSHQAGTPSRDVEANETEKKQTALKRSQFNAVFAAVETVKAVAASGAGGTTKLIQEMATAAGVAGVDQAALQKHLDAKSAQLNETIEQTRDKLSSTGKDAGAIETEIEAALSKLDAESSSFATMQAKLSAVR